ncbi:MAG: catalase family protein [Undibacterium sp.]|nr:catalase family protein [Undibacterium sp.]
MSNAQEIIPSNESAFIEQLAEGLKQRITEENKTGIMRRDTHAKMYGIVKAEFIVESKLPSDLAIGVFQDAKTYQAWIRFSNQDGDKPDIARDIRSMAIKLMGVPGVKLNAPTLASNTQDFVLMNPPMFIAKTPQEFYGFFSAVQGNWLNKLFFFSTHLPLVFNLFKAFIKIANPLQTRYFSTTPYLLGKQAVKYSTIPHVTKPDVIPQNPADDYLRLAMREQLQKGAAYFDFCVQRQTNADDMPIEDPTKVWSESLSAFCKVATIKILQQDFDNPTNNYFGEHISFNPWRVLPEHRPLGGINRTRRVVYEIISQFRHAYNQVERKEPESWEISAPRS